MGAAPCLKHPNNTGRYPKIDRGRGEGCRGFSQKKNTTATYLRHTAERQGNGAPWPRGHPSKSLVLLLMCRCPPGSKFQPKKYTHTHTTDVFYAHAWTCLICRRLQHLGVTAQTKTNMAKDNTKDRPSLLPRPASSNKEEREEGGTPDILGSVRLGLAVQMKEQLGRRGLTVRELGPGFGLVLVLPPFVLAVLFVSTDMEVCLCMGIVVVLAFLVTLFFLLLFILFGCSRSCIVRGVRPFVHSAPDEKCLDRPSAPPKNCAQI